MANNPPPFHLSASDKSSLQEWIEHCKAEIARGKEKFKQLQNMTVDDIIRKQIEEQLNNDIEGHRNFLELLKIFNRE